MTQTISDRDEFKAFLSAIETGDATALGAFLDWLRDQDNPAGDELTSRLTKARGRGKARAVLPVEPTAEDFVRATWQDRHDRVTHPEGSFDSARRWYPSACEDCGGSGSNARGPSRAFPYSYMLRCRSREHVRDLVAAALRGESVPADVVHTAGAWRAWTIRRYFARLQTPARQFGRQFGWAGCELS